MNYAYITYVEFGEEADTLTVPADPPQAKGPEYPPECHQKKAVDAQRAIEAVRALSKGNGQ